MDRFPTSKAEVPFLSELQFCSKVQVAPDSNRLKRKTPSKRSEISPGRFASSRSREEISASPESEIFFNQDQPEDLERKPRMASSSRASNRSPDDFAAFTQGYNNGHQNGDYYEYEDDDVEIDYDPHNGYSDDMPGLAPYAAEPKKQKVKAMKSAESRGRDPIKIPRVDLRSKFASMNEKVKRARMPSPGEMVDSYLNSGFHKQFKQPLAVRTRVEDVDVQRARQLLTQKMTPSELGNLRHPLDIPLPKLKGKANPETSEAKAKAEREVEEVKFDPRVQEGSRMYNTLPRSWRTQNLVTSVREISDLEELARRKQLIETKKPGELGNINSISDFPVPAKIKTFMSPSEKVIAAQKRHRSPENKEEGENTLKRSWTTTKLLTNTREIDDPLELARRQELIRSKSPAELAEIRSFNEIPVPTKIQGLFRSNSKTGSITRSESMPRNFSMYGTLPKSWKEQNLVTQVKVDQDPDLVAKRRALTQEKTPAELSQIYSIADLPIPTTLENFLKSQRNALTTDEIELPSKPIYKMNMEDVYNTLPKSLKAEVLVTSKVIEDPELLKTRQELTKTKTPRELSAINGLEDFPLPTRIEAVVRGSKRILKNTESKDQLGKRSKSWSELANIDTWKNSLPETMKAEVLVRTRIEDPELQKRRAELTKSCTVQQLSQINSFAEFPIPTPIEKIINNAAERKAAQKQEKTAEDRNKPIGEKLYDTLPRSMKSEVLVRVRDEDPELQRQRQELTRSKSPVELSRISSLSEFPVPKNIENLINKTKSDATDHANEPTPPPRRFRREDIYATLPASLKTEVLVKSKIETDEELLKQRQELTRSKSPAQLSEMRGFEDFPIPTFVENLAKKKITSTIEAPSEDLATMKGWYNTLPSSLKSEVLVRARQEDPEIQKARAEVIKTKSVNELSQIATIDDFPLPKSIDQLIGRTPRPVERRKKFRQMQRSESAKSMQDRVRNVVPESLKAQVLVKSRIEDAQVREQRRQIVQSKSVSELSQVSSFSDFPIPSTIERLVSKSKSELSSSQAVTAPPFDIHNIYGTLPASLKSEVLVRSRIESPDLLEQRRQVTQSKSVSELSQIQSLADFPIPTTIEKFIQARKQQGEAAQVEQDENRPPMTPARLQENIYATLPKSLKSEVLVRTRVESPDLLRDRQELVQSKSVSELSQMKSFADFPLPTSIEHLIQKTPSLKVPKIGGNSGESEIYESPSSASASGYNIYASLPRSLKKEVLVRSKVEENEQVLRERQIIVNSKSPGELSQIHSFAEVPLPRKIEDWLHQNEAGESRSLSGRSSSIPRNKQELKEIVYNKFLPESLTRPVVVRCKTEDPDLLKERQNVQQSKSIHELSKIRNLNEFPLPGNVKLPDVPLPSMKAMIGVIARTPNKNKKKAEIPPLETEEMLIGYSPASTPKTLDKTYTDDEMLRYEMSSPESMAHRDQDFDYEVIEAGSTSNQFGFMQTQLPVEETEESSISVADHYKGTPPLRSKKKKNRYSNEMSSEYQVKSGDELPPPIPTKKGGNKRNPLHGFDTRQEPRELTDQDLLDSSNDEMLFMPDLERREHYPPGPKIAYSYQHDPKVTPMRKTSSTMVPDETRPPADHERPPSRPNRSRRNSQDPGADPVAPGRSSSASGRRLSGRLAKSSSNNTMTSMATDQWHSVRSTKSTADDDTLVGSDDLHSCADTLNDQLSDEEFSLEMLPKDRNSRSNVH